MMLVGVARGKVYWQWSTKPGNNISENVALLDSALQEIGAWNKLDCNPSKKTESKTYV